MKNAPISNKANVKGTKTKVDDNSSDESSIETSNQLQVKSSPKEIDIQNSLTGRTPNKKQIRMAKSKSVKTDKAQQTKTENKKSESVPTPEPIPAEQSEITDQEISRLAELEMVLTNSKETEVEDFHRRVKAIFEIKRDGLHRGTHDSWAAYFKEIHGIGRAHAYRWACAGQLLNRVAPRGDTVNLLTTESHRGGRN
ncbi:MAG: hypothetical protein JWQ71_3675 [Pedosphaera sp.]|nr:hypothetical protein [Pedosphaera sp.]